MDVIRVRDSNVDQDLYVKIGPAIAFNSSANCKCIELDCQFVKGILAKLGIIIDFSFKVLGPTSSSLRYYWVIHKASFQGSDSAFKLFK